MLLLWKIVDVGGINESINQSINQSGGMSVISHRKAEANNKYMSSYNPEKPLKFITYLDANSLYS